MNNSYGRPTVIEVNLNAFHQNFQEFREIIPSNIAIMVAVKANAY